MKKIGERNEETNRLIVYFQNMPDGMNLTYTQIQADTEVKMDDNGKAMLRSALKFLKREYDLVKGVGIELSSARNTSQIMVTRMSKVSNSIKKADTTHQNLMKHYNDLNQQEQHNMNFIAGIFGAINAYAEQGRKYLKAGKHEPKELEPAKPIVPENVMSKFKTA